MPEPRPKLSIQIVMVGIAYVAICCAGVVPFIRDRGRPDFFTSSIVFLLAGNVIPGLMSGRGRMLAGYWGFALANLAALSSVLLFFEMTDAHVDAASGLLPMFGLYFGLPWLTVLVGYFGAWLARLRFDRRSREPIGLDPSGVS